MGSLTNLQYLLLNNNQLEGAIPTQLGSLTSLTQLYLHNNRLSEALPPELGSLANLQQLYLYNNPLSGPVPSGWGGTTYPLTALNHLDLSFTNLTGTLPSALAARRDADPPTLTVTWDTIVDQTTLPTEVASVRIEWASPPDSTVTNPTAFSVGPPASTTFPEPRQIYTLTALDSGGDAVTDRLSASIEVCLPRPAGLAAPLYLYRYQPAADATQPGRWERLTAGWRVSDREVCATVSQFSDFQVGTYTPPTDRGGGGGSGGVDIPPRDDHANTPWQATPIAPHGRAAGWLDTPRDIDFFTFTAPYAGVLVVETLGALDTHGTVWDRAGPGAADTELVDTVLTVVATAVSGGQNFRLSTQGAAGPVVITVVTADRGGSGQNFRLSTRVAAGPVVIAVRGNGRQTGRYLLQIALVGGYLENPAPASFQSGVGVLSGWACEGEGVEIEINGEVWPAAYGTERLDTATLPSGAVLCGDTDNGFGLLFNWNRLGDGDYEVVARLNGIPIGHRSTVDGIELGRATVTVTTLGEEFVEEVAGSCTVEDFPGPGELVTLVWQEGQQNFVIAGEATAAGENRTGEPGVGYLENPGANSFQSGVGVLSGWVCEAEAVEVEIVQADGTVLRQAAAYGTERLDTDDICGDSDNGFGLLFNWNRLGDGDHTVIALVDDEELGRATVQVTTLGEESARGLVGECVVEDFPSPGETVTLEWQQGQQNFVITGVD